jgi:hypothetical protein
MSQTVYFSYKMADSTRYFNEKFRGMLESGVYLGYNVRWNGVGYRLDFIHDNDPDNTGSKLGVLRTPDGTMCREDADQTAILTGVAPGAVPEMHYVIASYTYNASIPANVVTYSIQIVAPVGPVSLTDDDILIASIYVPVGAASYGAAGVTITNVGKKNLYGGTNSEQPTLKLDGILRPGIYDGMEIIAGSANPGLPDHVSINAGTWVTQENWKIEEASAQADLLHPTNPGLNSYRLSWVVGMHKYEDASPAPDVDYMLVEGTPVALGSAALLPNNAAILIVAAAVNAKYTANTYINKIGYIRSENRGGTFTTSYYRGETALEEPLYVVHGSEATSVDTRSGHYYGHQGLLQAISDIYTLLLVSDPIARLEKPYTICLDGDFELADTPLYIPSCVKLEGMGTASKITSENNDVVKMEGWGVAHDGANDAISILAVGGGAPPAGFERLDLQIRAVGAYRTGDDLVTHLFVPGDKVFLYDHIGVAFYEAIFVDYHVAIDNWTFYAYVPVAYRGAAAPPLTKTSDIFLMKRECHLANVEIDRIGTTAAGRLTMAGVECGSLQNVRTNSFTCNCLSDCSIDELTVVDTCTYGMPVGTGFSSVVYGSNRYGTVRLLSATSPLTFGTDEQNNTYELIQVRTTAVMDFRLACDSSQVGRISLIGAGGSTLGISGSYNTIDHVTSVVFRAGVLGNLVLYSELAVTDNSANLTNRVLQMASPSNTFETVEHINNDRNLCLQSLANIAWNATTGVLSWDDTITIDLPTETGTNTIAAGSVTLANDGQRAYIRLVRTSAGATAVAVLTKLKALAADLIRDQHALLLAVRKDSVIYLWDGTRIEHGQSVKLGSTPPPDGSVTYVKLAADAVEYHNEFFRDYVVIDPENNNLFTNDVIFRNTGLTVIAYNAATGEIQYNVGDDLSDVRVGDKVMLINNANASSPGCLTFEEIFAASDVTKRVTIAKGLTVVIGLITVWNGAIFRGNKVFTNDGLLNYTYDTLIDPMVANPGRITFAANTGFSQYQVLPGYVFVDDNGNKWKILQRDITGNGRWIEVAPGLRLYSETGDTRDLADCPAGVVSSRMSGSIETDNNPQNAAIADCRVLSGAEFIPIDNCAEPDEYGEDWNWRKRTTSGGDLVRHNIHPYDPRVKMWKSPQYISFAEIPPNGQEYACISYSDGGIEFTGVCTGIALILSSGTVAPVVSSVHIDGALWSNLGIPAFDTETLNNVYSYSQHKYQVIPIISRLPQDVHNIHIINIVGAGSLGIRGILILNQFNDDSALQYVYDTPGKVVRSGDVVSLTQQHAQNLPVNPATYKKGGRIIRYVNSSNVRAWASSWVRSITNTGTWTNIGVTVSNVSNIDVWRVGDLIKLIDPVTGAVNIRRIVDRNIGANTMDLDSNPTFGVGAATNFHYYGHVYTPPITVGGLPRPRHYRTEEEIAFRCPITEFAAAHTLNINRGACGLNSPARIPPIGVRLSDASTALSASAGMLNTTTGGRLATALNSMTIRLYFIGTGLSMIIKNASANDTQITLRVDNCAAGTIYLTANDISDDPGGTYLCGDLSYGFHVVEISTAAALAVDLELADVTVWQPKKPTLPANALELIEMNYMDNPGSAAIELPADGYGNVYDQTIQYDACSMLYGFTGAAVIVDAGSAFDGATVARYFQAPGTTAVDQPAMFSFYGSMVTIVTKTVAVGGGGLPFNVLIQDTDFSWKAPSALAGITLVGGPDTIGATVVAGERTNHIWTFATPGFYSFQIVDPDGGGGIVKDIQIDSIEVKTPFHNYLTKQPVCLDHLMPYCHAGVDKRNLVPVNSDLLPKAQVMHRQHALLHSSPISLATQVPFHFYCRGGWVKLSCTCLFTPDPGGAGLDTVLLMVDNVNTGASSFATTAAVAVSVTLTTLINLTQGFHFAYIDGDDTTNDTIEDCAWTMEQVSEQPATQLASRGFGVPMLGPCNPGEASF